MDFIGSKKGPVKKVPHHKRRELSALAGNSLPFAAYEPPAMPGGQNRL